MIAGGGGRAQRWAVHRVAPPGYEHAEAFREVADTLLHGFRTLGLDVVETTDPRQLDGRRAVVLGANLLPRHPQPLPADAILYNLEQVAPDSSWFGDDYLALLRAHPVWDYSRRNLAALAALGVRGARLLPVGWAPVLERIAPAPEEPIDVLLYGSLNDRRWDAIDAVAARGLRAEAMYGAYGAPRDAAIAASKLVLNVHYFEAKVFEVVRVSYLLANGRCVVSERGADPDEDAEFADGVAFADFDQLAERCAALCADPMTRRALAARGRALMRDRPIERWLAPLVRGD